MRKMIFMTIAAFLLQFVFGQGFSEVRQLLEDQFSLEFGQTIEWSVNSKVPLLGVYSYDKFNPEFEIVEL